MQVRVNARSSWTLPHSCLYPPGPLTCDGSDPCTHGQDATRTQTQKMLNPEPDATIQVPGCCTPDLLPAPSPKTLAPGVVNVVVFLSLLL